MKKIEYKTYSKPTDFAKFEQGDTTIRIVSSGGLVKKHGMRTAHGYIPLGDCTETADCELCAKGNDAKIKWIWICLVRTTSEVKLLEVGPQIGDAICKIAQTQEKDPQEFDLVISKVGNGLKTKYSVRIGEVKPLTEAELKEVNVNKHFLINKYFKK